MSEFMYFVEARTQPSRFDALVKWLQERHLGEVVAASGALSGELVMLDPLDGDDRKRVVSVYRFASKDIYETYIKGEAKRAFDANAVERGDTTEIVRSRGPVAYQISNT